MAQLSLATAQFPFLLWIVKPQFHLGIFVQQFRQQLLKFQQMAQIRLLQQVLVMALYQFLDLQKDHRPVWQLRQGHAQI